MTTEFDVIICGAGPAGCTAALALGTSGLRVALIEKHRFPREKVCGDGLPAYVPKVLNTIDSEYKKAFEQLAEKTEVNICRVIAPDERILDLKFSESGFICRRIIFDAFLFGLVTRLPNIAAFQGTSIKDVTADDNEVTVRTDTNMILKAKLVIGCDGAHSIVRRKLAGTKIDLSHCSGAARAYFRNVRNIQPRTLELHFLRDLLPGYFWIFPLAENTANVGLGIPSGTIAEKRINPAKELTSIIENVTYLKRRFSDAEMTGGIKGYLLPLGSRKTCISGKRFMLCGDAASLVNPASGAGIGQAMQSGRFAGWHAARCFERNDFSADFLKIYDKTVYDKLWHENKHYYLIRELVFNNQWRMNSIISAGQKSKLFNKMIIRHLK
jgi:geranylgeranyl reductase family protein